MFISSQVMPKPKLKMGIKKNKINEIPKNAILYPPPFGLEKPSPLFISCKLSCTIKAVRFLKPSTFSFAIALKNPRSQRFQQPTLIAGLFADSGGASVGVADLELPGDFAFSNQGTSEMIPADPSLQNRRRQLITTTGTVTVSIT